MVPCGALTRLPFQREKRSPGPIRSTRTKALEGSGRVLRNFLSPSHRRIPQNLSAAVLRPPVGQKRRHRICEMLRLRILAYPDARVAVSGVLGTARQGCLCEPISRPPPNRSWRLYLADHALYEASLLFSPGLLVEPSQAGLFLVQLVGERGKPLDGSLLQSPLELLIVRCYRPLQRETLEYAAPSDARPVGARVPQNPPQKLTQVCLTCRSGEARSFHSRFLKTTCKKRKYLSENCL
jgi:hypothetical protein